MSEPTPESVTRLSPRRAAAIVLVALAIGGALRLDGLEDRTMGHIEAYVPGIEFPEGISAPYPRITFVDTLKRSFEEPHPPAWYVLNWPWTKVFGTELFWLRLPSVLAGLLGILLIYRVGADLYGRATGATAALLLALSGYHVFWSQIARPYALAPAIALLSTAALLRCLTSPASARWRTVYLAVTLLGLGNSYYYWLFFAAQMSWVGAACWGRREDLRGLLRGQVVALIFATPIVALAIFQQRESYLVGNLAAVADSLWRELLALGYAFQPFGDPVRESGVWPDARLALAAVTALLALIGLGYRRDRGARGDGDDGPGYPTIIASALIAGIAIVGGAWYIRRTGRYPDKERAVMIVTGLPVVLGVLAVLERRFGIYTRAPRAALAWLTVRMPGVPLALWVIMVPLALVVAVILRTETAFYAARHVLTFVPFLFILAARGLVRLVAAPSILTRSLAVAIGAFLLVMMALGLRHHAERPSSPRLDYGLTAGAWLPQVRDGDLVFMPRHWVNTPILYYMRYGEYHYVWRDFAAAREGSPTARVWNVTYDGITPSRDLRNALEGMASREVIESPGICIELLVPRAGAVRRQAQTTTSSSAADEEVVVCA